MVHIKGYMYKWIMQDLRKKCFSFFSYFWFLKPARCCTYAVTLCFTELFSWTFIDKFILKGEETDAVLHRLASHGKKLFLITNSPFSFV